MSGFYTTILTSVWPLLYTVVFSNT